MSERLERMTEFYTSGPVPWDQPDPPPEVLEFAPTLPPGRALDLGCGPGRASIYLASLGWQVDGVDFVPQAIEIARQRAQAAGVSGATFHAGPVTSLPQLSGPYDLALDVGCAHSFSVEELTAYHAELLRLLRPGATYLMFAHLGETEDDRWLAEPALLRVFADGFELERVEHGETTVRGDTWRSAWFWFRRLADGNG
jgi:cyclopropane fatty-acyl-phospholipid synthase-like methyltransferase